MEGSPLSGHGRLNGWKEIAAHLGKSVRTAQRWERELSLPVRRIHTAGGEIVFAFRHEIDDWLKSFGPEGPAHSDGKETNDDSQPNGRDDLAARPVTPTPPIASPAAQPRRHTILWMAAGAALLLVVSWVLLRGFGPDRLFAGPPPQPATWKVEGGLLKVFDSSGQPLWQHSFGLPLLDASYAPGGGFPRERSAFIADLDADGTQEVGIILRAENGAHASFEVLNHDGSLRYSTRFDRSVQFGDVQYAAPWYPSHLLLTDEPGGGKSVWLTYTHNLWFPALLQKLGPRGEVLAEYWSNGHIATLCEGTFQGRRSMFVGATSNEHQGASLAVLDYEKPSGAAPAAASKYRCMNCPASSPLAFFVFPRSELTRLSHYRAHVSHCRKDGLGNQILSVNQGQDDPAVSQIVAASFYVLSPDGRILEGETGDSYRQLHSRFEARNRLNHPFRLACEEQLFPVLRWDHAAQRFVPEHGRLSDPPH